ncbi:hypothetical protein NLI96_g787 [Meripilus lineatus]|uniref:Extracellular serine-rich protein n=1 Tax=Meripilus lineatus TaxID=2056292 RepID=A0AAD5VBM5_9APHY|nr:hypothetical protein NLI96_g787 [Physisporinus lineatus]
MRFLTAFSTLGLVALAAAQDANSTTVVTVQVGSTASAAGGVFQFIPPTFNATKGSVISFQFTGSPGNHTVSQSSFTNPCTPLQGGFSSGFISVPANTTAFPVWNLTIEDDTRPIWFFCAQPNPTPHCGNGMVGAINAPLTGNTFQSFQTSARLLNNTVPPVPSGALSGSGAAASLQPGPLLGSVTGAALPPGSTPAPSATAPAPGASGSSVSGSGSQSGTAPGASNTSNDASTLATGGFVGFVSALLGVFLF